MPVLPMLALQFLVSGAMLTWSYSRQFENKGQLARPSASLMHDVTGDEQPFSSSVHHLHRQKIVCRRVVEPSNASLPSHNSTPHETHFSHSVAQWG
ncbi:unnamed protein product [Protopolystoma xenopodis]|uniref:Secreted protein n=1 Tax=Protopolystoma xenopodis TaxID=117903 RepID=A0A3S5A5N5_9PLAT|nr:unnamed protein product [Protopolystoma xenopodis]